MEIFKTIVVTVLPCIVAIVTTVLSVIKIVTKGKVDLQFSGLSDFQKMHEELKKLIMQAEVSYNAMKNVNTKLQLFAVANKIDFDENLWCMYLEEEMKYTNTVNTDKSTRMDKGE